MKHNQNNSIVSTNNSGLSNGNNNTIQSKDKSEEPQTSNKQEIVHIREKKIHPKLYWDLSDEEWTTFGDRFPLAFNKIRLLGRGGFSLVWLGEHKKTRERYAIKQIITNNSH